MRYFSERETGESPRESEEVGNNVWRGILAVIRGRVADGSFGAKYPDICPDGTFVTGVNMMLFDDALKSEIPGLAKFKELHHDGYNESTVNTMARVEEVPSTLDILDLIEFSWKSIGDPVVISSHSFFSHSHLKFDADAGRERFSGDIETIFRRNSIAYVLTEEGRIERLVPPAFQAVVQPEANTGDMEFDRLLGTAQYKFLHPRPETRREALEALWDAWERLKTLDGQGDKKAQTTEMLNKTAGKCSPKFREALDREAIELTGIGNSLRIRHSETNQEMLATSGHVDYLFYRLFSLIQLVLKSR